MSLVYGALRGDGTPSVTAELTFERGGIAR